MNWEQYGGGIILRFSEDVPQDVAGIEIVKDEERNDYDIRWWDGGKEGRWIMSVRTQTTAKQIARYIHKHQVEITMA